MLEHLYRVSRDGQVAVAGDQQVHGAPSSQIVLVAVDGQQASA
jgi:hypothetical protein